jgi:transposase
VVKWSQRRRATGSCAPDKTGGRKPYVLKDKERNYIRMRLQAEPHATLRAIQL